MEVSGSQFLREKMEQLLLDSRIGGCVLLPIFLLVLLTTFLRQKLMGPQPKLSGAPDMEQQVTS